MLIFILNSYDSKKIKNKFNDISCVARFRKDDETDHQSQRSFHPCVLSICAGDPKMPSKWLRNVQRRRKSALRRLQSSVCASAQNAGSVTTIAKRYTKRRFPSYTFDG